MAHKAFYVTRTEDPATHTAGAATLNRADKPQLVKVYDTATDVESDIANIGTDEVVGTKESDFEAVAVVDRVAKDNLNPVTSNAVATALSYSTEETLTGGYWIDGKPIYRKVLPGPYSFAFTGASWNNTSIDMTGVDVLVNVIFISNSCVMNGFYTRITSNKLEVYVTANVVTGVTGPIVLEYTKTE